MGDYLVRQFSGSEIREPPLVTPQLGQWVDADREFASTPWWESVR